MNSFRRALPAALAVIMLLASTIYAVAAESGVGNFKYSDDYTAGQFLDVSETDWFAHYVGDAYNYGFVSGKSPTSFDPGGFLTFGEAVKLVARLRSIYYTGSADFTESEPFYDVYIDYALSAGIMERWDGSGGSDQSAYFAPGYDETALRGTTSGPDDYAAPITRSRFAELIYNAMPSEVFSTLNIIPDFGICDVSPDAIYGPATYALYRSGIIAGSDRYGTFYPGSAITRAEACAVMVRLADPVTRLRFSLPPQIPVETIFQRSADAVFMIDTFDLDGKSIRTASGFFISESGLAVTNLHVIVGAASAVITLYNGDTFAMSGIHAISEEFNLIVFSLDTEEAGRSYLTLADSGLLEVGSSVYAIGSPLSLINTISAGVISHTARDVSGETLIQFTAPISFGSGGSPLLNTLGQVVGVISSSFSYGQNLNLAVPINHIRTLVPDRPISLETLLKMRSEE